MLDELHVDIETCSAANLPKVGAHHYARHPSTRVLMIGWAINDAPADVVDLEHGEPLPTELVEAYRDPAVTKWAHNAQFETANLTHAEGPDPLRRVAFEEWRCTMVWAFALSLPGGLAALSEVLRLGDKAKHEHGARLIQTFSVEGSRRKPRPGDWDLFLDYCRQDVEAERAVAKRLDRYPMLESEWRLWHLDQLINDRGLPIDRDFVRRVMRVAAQHREDTLEAAAQLTGLENPNSPKQMKQWLADNGALLPDMRKDTIERATEQDLDPHVREALEHRQQLSRSSIAKYEAAITAVCDDGNLRGVFQFNGARRTQRWAGRLFQPHNLPRPTMKPEEVDTARYCIKRMESAEFSLCYADVSGALSSMVRGAIAAPNPDDHLLVADYASIESVMLAWCCESEYLLALFRQGRDPYIDFAARIFGIPYEAVTKDQRTFAKPAVLGCGYFLGAPGLVAYAAGMGVTLSLRDAHRHVDTFRESYSDIPEFWRRVQKAALRAVANKNQPSTVGRFRFLFDGLFLRLSLPSGRDLYYYKPSLRQGKYGWELTYEGNQPGFRISTNPGKITENIVQALARDLLADGLRRVHAGGLYIIGHVHDEIIALLRAAGITHAEAELARMIDLMTQPSKWCADLPLRAAGYISPYYKKD